MPAKEGACDSPPHSRRARALGASQGLFAALGFLLNVGKTALKISFLLTANFSRHTPELTAL
jgi:hypothetical protein